MKTILPCMKCLNVETKTTTFALVEYFDGRSVEYRCPREHVNHMVFQEQRFEVLLTSGAQALAAGFTIEAVTTTASALERFTEFAIRVLSAANGLEHPVVDAAFKDLSRQSERQIGAFLYLHAVTFDERYPMKARDSIVPRRNKFVHRGVIPTPNEARQFCRDVFDEIRRYLMLLHDQHSLHLRATISHDIRGRQPTKSPGLDVTASGGGGGQLLPALDPQPPEFDDAFARVAGAAASMGQRVRELEDMGILVDRTVVQTGAGASSNARC